MKHRWLVIIGLLALVGLVLVACGDDVNVGSDEWVLQSYGDANNPGVMPDDAEATLAFDPTEGRVSGVAFCNRYFGPYELDGNNLSFEMLAQTEMACMGPNMMEAESAYLKALGAAETVEVDGDTLRITYDGGVLVFSK